MKPSTKNLLEDIDSSFLLEIIENLCDKYGFLEGDINFLIAPKKVKFAQAYYNKLVKLAIDTNSYSKFPNKGARGLNEMLTKAKFLESIGNLQEAKKLGKAIYEVIARCERNYNSNNEDELDSIKYSIVKLL